MSIVGFIEAVTLNQIRGWAYDPSRPSAHLDIVICVGDVPFASGRADIERQDLQAARIGAGDHGFVINLVPQISLDALGKLDVFAISGALRNSLPRVPSEMASNADRVSDNRLPIADELQFPVFILGAARSGTSAIALGLLDGGRYEGFGEGHLLPLAHELLSIVDNYYHRNAGDGSDTVMRNVPVQAFQNLIRRSFVQMTQSLFPTGYWVDKTPTVEMVRASPLMREIWPNARFIFMKRRVIENVISRQRKFPLNGVEMHYSDWIAVMSAWLEVRDKLIGVSLEVEQRDLASDPEGTAARIGQFLCLPSDAAMRLARYLSTNRPEQTAKTFGAIHTIDHLGLTEQEARWMTTACDPMMTAFGYVYGKNYSAKAQRKRYKTVGGTIPRER